MKKTDLKKVIESTEPKLEKIENALPRHDAPIPTAGEANLSVVRKDADPETEARGHDAVVHAYDLLTSNSDGLPRPRKIREIPAGLSEVEQGEHNIPP